MNILQLASADFAGVGMKLVNAINRYGGGEFESRLVTARGHSLGFQGDISVRGKPNAGKIIKKWIEWADVVNVHNHYGMLQRVGIGPGDIKRLVITHHGTNYRHDPAASNRLDIKWGAMQLVTTPDLAAWGPTWIPTAIPVDVYLQLAEKARKRRSSKSLKIVCQAPSNIVRKNTKEVAAQVKGIEGITWRAIIKTKHSRCLRLKAESWIGVDQFRLGLGVNGYEFMAMRIPVIAWAEPQHEQQILAHISPFPLPYFSTKIKNIRGSIIRLRGDPELYEKYAERGLEYVRQFHSMENVADRYVEFLKAKVL